MGTSISSRTTVTKLNRIIVVEASLLVGFLWKVRRAGLLSNRLSSFRVCFHLGTIGLQAARHEGDGVLFSVTSADELSLPSRWPTFSFWGHVAGVSSSSSAGELAQAVSQSFCSVLFGSALLVGSLLDSWEDTSACVGSHQLETDICTTSTEE